MSRPSLALFPHSFRQRGETAAAVRGWKEGEHWKCFIIGCIDAAPTAAVTAAKLAAAVGVGEIAKRSERRDSLLHVQSRHSATLCATASRLLRPPARPHTAPPRRLRRQAMTSLAHLLTSSGRRLSSPTLTLRHAAAAAAAAPTMLHFISKKNFTLHLLVDMYTILD